MATKFEPSSRDVLPKGFGKQAENDPPAIHLTCVYSDVYMEFQRAISGAQWWIAIPRNVGVSPGVRHELDVVNVLY